MVSTSERMESARPQHGELIENWGVPDSLTNPYQILTLALQQFDILRVYFCALQRLTVRQYQPPRDVTLVPVWSVHPLAN